MSLQTVETPMLGGRARGGDGMHDREQFAGYLTLQGLADSTVRTYVALYQRWVDWCVTEGRDPTRLDPLSVRAWSRTVHGSRSMLDQAAATINHACDMYGVDATGDAIPRPRKPRAKPDALSESDAVKLEEAAHTQGLAGTAVLVGLYTAARRSEIAGMEWSRVEDTTVEWWRPKTRDWHRVPLHPVLRDHLEPRRSGRWLFPGRWGGHVAPGVINEWVEKVSEAAGIPRVTPKQLRSTSLTWINERTGDIRAAQEVAGHTSIETTTAYTRVSQRRMLAAVESLDYQTA